MHLLDFISNNPFVWIRSNQIYVHTCTHPKVQSTFQLWPRQVQFGLIYQQSCKDKGQITATPIQRREADKTTVDFQTAGRVSAVSAECPQTQATDSRAATRFLLNPVGSVLWFMHHYLHEIRPTSFMLSARNSKCCKQLTTCWETNKQMMSRIKLSKKNRNLLLVSAAPCRNHTWNHLLLFTGWWNHIGSQISPCRLMTLSPV